ncbi:RHS repeat-associated core domain-containing protein [Kitasatospora sp. NPDC056327]|uniref:RHS repeat-associated core domain-containing protein n=1 Tax=Kitasatospora sp. NPDC056327 TaxID=3345785 RepID=UPI0035D7F313
MSSLLLLGALVGPVAPALAAPPQDGDQDRIWSPPNTPLPKTASVPGTAEKPTPVPPATGSPNWVPPRTAPALKSGTAAVDLGADGASGGSQQAGELPVWLTPLEPGGSAPGPVRVEVADGPTTGAAGVQGALVALSREGRGGSGKVRIGLDPNGTGFGGDFAARSQLVSLPACALTTPQDAACLTRTPVPSHYDAQARQLVADVELPPAAGAVAKQGADAGQGAQAQPAGAPAEALVLATEATPGGGTGTYSATSLAPSQAWTAGSSSGSFTYSYPVQSPPSLGGTGPKIALGYDSASVDGRTASTNAQASWIGDGWDLSAGFIERSFKPCAKAGIANSSDQCWGGANLTMALGGHAGELVPDDSSCVGGDAAFEQSKCTWRLKKDDGTKVEFLTGATNGTWNNGYLKVTDSTGTVYYFGLNHLPSAAGGPTAAGPESRSAWTVPVYSPNAGDPCYDAAKGKGSWCRMAWRWNLDHVVDVHGNLTTYTYTPESNWYARGGGQNPGAGVSTEYTRGGVLASIGYGQLLGDGGERPAAKIDFDSGERCVTSTAACDPAQRTTANAAHWPDVPLDKQCAATGACTTYGPTYWSTKWLNRITTSVRSNGSYRPVDAYELTHVFKTPQNAGENQQIPWLESVKRYGKDTFDGQEAQELPKVTFASVLLPNRVDGLTPARPRYNRPRIEVITTETGGTVNVDYLKDSCSRTANRMPAAADNNALACYNVKWYDTAVAATVDDWFLRYPVASVTVDPNGNLVQGSAAQTTAYTYGPAAWHRNDGALVEPDHRTWDQFRGFQSVTAVTGSGQDGAKSKSTTSYHQGMDGDIKANGTAKPASVAGARSGARTDHDWLSGRVLESDAFADAAASAPESWTVSTSSGPATTATHSRGAGLPALVARYGSTTTTATTTARTTTGTRTTATVSTTDAAHGNRVTTSLSTADGTPDVCVRTDYATAADPALTGLVSQALTVSGANACTAAPTAANTVAGSRTLYDGAAFGSAGTKGAPTGTQVLDGYDAGGAARWLTTATTAYDGYGRPTGVTDPTATDAANPAGAVQTTSYSSANPGELVNRTVTGTPAPAGAPDAGARRETVVTLNPARGLALTTTDPNSRKVTQKYDGLGRLKAVWTAERPTGSTASLTFDYAVNGTTAPSAVTSRTLRPGDTYAVSTRIADGLGRTVQTQDEPAVSAYHGRTVTDTFYDSQGRANRTYHSYYEETTAPTAVRWQPNGAQVPSETRTAFDGSGRPTSVQAVAYGVPQNTTSTAYPGADRVDTTPPAGATATSTVTDARGRTVELWQYRTPSATGNRSDADVTVSTFTPSDLTATRVDAAGNTWSYGYDQRGRQVRTDDPDSGVSTRAYDAAGRLTATTDARGQTVAVAYDLLGRRTGTYSGSIEPANQLTGFAYDTVAKGQPSSSTRYVGGAGGTAYTKAVTAVDTAYRPTATTVTIPGSEIGRSGQATFDYSSVYDPISGALTSEGRAAAGDLAQEFVSYRYEVNGPLHDMDGAGITYLRQADWDAYGRNIRATMNSWGTQVVSTNTYDESTGRLLSQYVDKQTATTGTVQNTTYAYNQAGRITAVRGIPDNTPSAADLQCFTYDHLGRLTVAWTDKGRLDQPNPSVGGQGACAGTAPSGSTVGGSAAYWQEYGYDLTGNRTQIVHRNVNGDAGKDVRVDQTFPAAGARNTPNATGGTGGPHAMATSTTTFGTAAEAQGTNQYDAAGNTTKITNPGANKQVRAGFVLGSGESIRSNSVQLAMQADGNLVLTSLRSDAVLWSTNTQGHPGAWATMQDDGNFVVYDPQHTSLWSSNTWAGPASGYYAMVQDDGKFVVYAPGWQAKWGTETWNFTDAGNGAVLTWDAEGKLSSMNQNSQVSSYLYDAEGNQLVRRSPGRVTVHLGGGDELTYNTGTGAATGTRHYTIPGGITLVRQGATKLTYQFADHHGTNALSIDSTSLAESRRPTDPFGVTRGATSSAAPWAGLKGFVGGLKDGATGFTNLGARQYQPSTGRFLSPDPVFDASDPGQWNAYVYGNNDPVNRADPNGLKSEECGTLYDCGSAGTITMKNAAETTANYVPPAALQRLDETLPSQDFYNSAKAAGWGAKPRKSERATPDKVSPGPNKGIIMARFYIGPKRAAVNQLLGDDRSWSNHPVDSARMTLFWDTATGETSFTVMASTRPGHFAPAEGSGYPASKRGPWIAPSEIPARRIVTGKNGYDLPFWSNGITLDRGENGLKAKITGINSLVSFFSIDGSLSFSLGSDGIKVNRSGDAYPDLEVVQYQRGQAPQVLARDNMSYFPADPGINAAPGIGDKVDRTYLNGGCISGC